MNADAQSAFQWWGRRRLRYNIGLAVAGILAFLCYCVVVYTLLPRVRYIDSSTIEVTIFTMAFQAFCYLILMGIANICYFIGPLSERVVRPANVLRYRETSYQPGFWFSFTLPFTVPVVLAILVLLYPEYWKH